MRASDNETTLVIPANAAKLVNKLPTSEWEQLVFRLNSKANTFGMAMSSDADMIMRMVPDSNDVEHLLLSSFIRAAIFDDAVTLTELIASIQGKEKQAKEKRDGRGDSHTR